MSWYNKALYYLDSETKQLEQQFRHKIIGPEEYNREALAVKQDRDRVVSWNKLCSD